MQRGERGLLPPGSLEVEIGLTGPATEYDFAVFALDSGGKTIESYMLFFNQMRSPAGEAEIASLGPKQIRLRLDPGRFPANVQKLVFTTSTEQGHYGLLQQGYWRLSSGKEYQFRDSEFGQEKALIIGEFYRKDAEWRYSAVGQGFNGGLADLVRHFGGEVADAAPAAPPSPPPAAAPSGPKLSKLSLEKIQEKAPELVSLVKQARVSLEKKGLADHTAQVALVLDISGSMAAQYSSGKIQRLAERVLALGTQFDDNGSIEVFLFGERAYYPGSMSLDNFKGFVSQVTRRFPLEGDTRYGEAMGIVREHYMGNDGPRSTVAKGSSPIYVLFLTDGAPSDRSKAEAQVRFSSYEPIFWMFVGLGKSNKTAKGFFANLMASDFSFLEKLDDLTGRHVDNADFFSVENLDQMSDTELYERMMQEYPSYLQKGKQAGLW